MHIVFDGVSETALSEASRDAGVSDEMARAAFPKGAQDLGVAMHLAGDTELARRMASEDMTGLRYSEKVARAIMIRLEIAGQNKNWYSKRTILSAVYSASLLYWLGDDSEGSSRTKTFVDRRIENVMSFEKTKAQVKDSKLYQAFRQGPGKILDSIKAPGLSGMNDLPGQWRK